MGSMDDTYCDRIRSTSSFGWYDDVSAFESVDAPQSKPFCQIEDWRNLETWDGGRETQETQEEVTDVEFVVPNARVTSTKTFRHGNQQPEPYAVSIGSTRVRRVSPFAVYAEYQVLMSTKDETYKSWKRFSDFKLLAEYAKISDLRDTVTAWTHIQQTQRWFRCLEANYLKTKCRLLEKFLAHLLFEVHTPSLLMTHSGGGMSAILVVGSSGSGKKTLVQGLVRLLDACPEPIARDDAEGHELKTWPPTALGMPKSERQELIEQADATFDVHPASIATKYYNAQVAFWRQAQATVPVLALRSADKLEGLEGIIVLFDLSQESSFAEAAQWSAFVDDREQCAFRVCVGSKLDLVPEGSEEPAGGSGYGEEFSPPPEATAPAEQNGGGNEGGPAAAAMMAEGVQDRRARCLEWCLDHGFEYVEADCRDLERGGAFREKEGLPRIVEALQSNVWTGMEFCTDSRPSLMAAPAVAGGSKSGGDGNIDGSGSASTSSVRDGDPAAGSSSTGPREQEVSEYLSGFVDGDDGLGEYADYGALDSGGEEEDDGENEDEGAEDMGPGGRKTDSEPAEAGYTCGVAAIAGGGGSEEGGEGGAVDPAHIEARWEQRVPGCPPPNAAPAGGEAATRQNGSGLPESIRESAPAHDHDEGKKVGADVKPGDVAATSACVPPNGSTGASRSDGGEGGCGKCDAIGGEGGASEVGPSATKSEDNLLKSAGSMVEELGGDFEGDEMEKLMSEVRKARELGSSVSDAERRARAADVAMRLAALLGELGDDSGDDDDDER
eukprot:g16382.t1